MYMTSHNDLKVHVNHLWLHSCHQSCLLKTMLWHYAMAARRHGRDCRNCRLCVMSRLHAACMCNHVFSTNVEQFLFWYFDVCISHTCYCFHGTVMQHCSLCLQSYIKPDWIWVSCLLLYENWNLLDFPQWRTGSPIKYGRSGNPRLDWMPSLSLVGCITQ